MEKKTEVRSEKKGLWSILKESMTKTSSGCGPGCGCHSQEPITKNQKDDPSKKSDKE